MSQRRDKLKPADEAQLQLIIQAIQRNATLSQRRAAAIYRVPQSTLSDQLAGTTFRRNYAPNSMKLLKTEEGVVAQHVFNLDVRGYPPRLAALKGMADSLLAERHRDLVGQNWAATFVKGRPKLKVMFNRKYNYKRALYEDPKVIQGWFRLVANIKAKYGILNNDTYNFNESSFIMG
jgi:hypothetical protein